ncbi:MAG: hypothetical protein QOE90_726 [Thermoplasmata archaeon]|jgi:hypothetical protein|nr:hypothetical protein [Thermoplasmata archaeon]
MTRSLLLLALVLVPLALTPLAVAAAPESPAYFTRCQTAVAGLNCITPDGWYCWVWVDAGVQQVCYRPL